MGIPQPFVGRESELEAFGSTLAEARKGVGALLLVSGPAGIGKTRFLEAAADEARRAGFAVGSGLALIESFVLYHPWNEALSRLDLDHLLREEPPPRLLALYVVSASGLPVVRAERPGFSEDPALLSMMLNNAGEFLRDAIRPAEGTGEGDLMRLAVGGRGVSIVKGRHAALLAVFEGRETEIFLRDVRRLMDEVTRRGLGRLEDWDGNKGTVRDLEGPPIALLQSGKYDGVDLAADGQARKLNLFDNVLFGLRRQAASKPIVILMDDLQWADPSSLGLLHYLARNARDAPIVFVGAYRSEERDTRAHLREALASIEGEEISRAVRLEALSGTNSRRLAQELLGPNILPDEFFQLMAKETEGSPMIMREVIAQFLAEGVLFVDAADGLVRIARPIERLKVPGRIRDAVANRLARLDRPDRELLDAAAVCGTRFEGALLARLAGDPELAVQRRLSSIARGLGVVRPEGNGWRFDHPVVREVVYDTMAPALRRLYHREAGEFLLSSGGAGADVGEHFAEAGDARAVAPLLAAGESALVRGSPYEAARMFEKAATVATPPERADLEARRAAALELAGRYEEALAAVDRAEALGADPVRSAEMRATVLQPMSRFEEVISVVDGALPQAQGDRAGRLLTLRARALNALARYAEAGAAAGRALDCIPAGDNLAQAEALREAAKTELYLGRYDAAMEKFSRALKLSEEAGDRRSMGQALAAIAATLSNRGDTDLAIDAFRRAQPNLEAVGDRAGLAICEMNMAEGLADSGEFDEALERAGKAHALAASTGAIGIATFAENTLGYVLAYRGEAERALEWFERSSRAYRSLGHRRGLSVTLAESVRPRLAVGAVARALRDADEALTLTRETNDRPNEAVALRARAEVAAAQGDAEAMRGFFTQAQESFEALKQPREIAENHVRWAQAAQRMNLLDASKDHWLRAAEIFDAARFPRRAAAARAALDSITTADRLAVRGEPRAN